MAWLSLLPSSVSSAKLREHAHGIAARSQAAIADRVAHRLLELPLSQARGYVRARSASILRREVELLVASQPRLRSCREELHRMASETVIRQVVWQMLRERKQQQAAPAWLRAA